MLVYAIIWRNARAVIKAADDNRHRLPRVGPKVYEETRSGGERANGRERGGARGRLVGGRNGARRGEQQRKQATSARCGVCRSVGRSSPPC